MKEQLEKIKEKNPFASDIMCFIKAVKGKKMTESQLINEFDKYVPHSDYIGTPKKQIIDWLSREILKK